jgi:FKBP-type peptidyl-prolyl cis-trans isomerase
VNDAGVTFKIEESMKRLVVSLVCVAAVLGLTACGGGAATPAPTTAPVVPTTSAPTIEAGATPASAPKVAPPIPLDDAKMQTTASGLKFADVVAGTGATPASTDWVTMQFTATLQDETLISASRTSGGPMSVPLSEVTKQVAGWGEGLSTMKVGGVRELVIPSNLAYGEKGVGPIPPNSTLVFIVELLDTKPAPKVKIDDTVVGTGAVATDGMSLQVNYTGTLESGKVFDSSYGKPPFEFVLGKGEVIPGWDQGLQGMKVGGKRTLTIPSELGYGARGAGDTVPPNSNLIFEVELLDVQQPAQVKIEDTVVGTGAEAVPGATITVNYTGTLEDGTVFDSSYKRNEPFTLQLDAGQVIPGWDQGLQGMKVGGKRTLTIPPSLGYGAQGAGSAIPPNATLIFEVELLDVK